jgi:putative pyruvate formate lyase activating enzyme
VITRNLRMAYEYSVEGIPSEGIIRHLVLPNHVECCTKPILRRIADNTPRRLVNVMDQYYPTFKVPGNPQYREIDRRITPSEYSEAVRYARSLGLVLVDR